MSVDEVLDTINAIDKRATVAAFATDLALDDFDDAKAIKYEWYYDGREPAEYAEAYTFATCEQPYAYSDTDLVKVPKLGVESDVKLDDAIDEQGGIEIGRVLGAQHELCAKVDEHYLHIEAETKVPAMTREQRVALPVLYDAYRNLFDLRLYELLYEAAQQVTARPDWVFVGTHERWPILVGTPPSRTVAKRPAAKRPGRRPTKRPAKRPAAKPARKRAKRR